MRAKNYKKCLHLRITCKNFICVSFYNLTVDRFFVTLNKLNILLELNFDLHRTFIYSFSTVLLVSKIK